MTKLIMFIVGALGASAFQNNPELVSSLGVDGSFIETNTWLPIIAGVLLTFIEGSDWPPIVKNIIRGLFKDVNVDSEGGAHLRKILNDALDFLAYLKKSNAGEDAIETQEKLVSILSDKCVKEGVTK